MGTEHIGTLGFYPGPANFSIYLEESTKSNLRAYLTGGDVAATAATDQLRQLGRLGRPKNGFALSPRRRRAAATAETDQSRKLGMACALTSRRRLRDLLETEKVSPQKSNMFEFPATPRRRRGDVSATSGDSSRHLVAT